MTDKFDKALEKYRKQIKEGDLDSLKENLTSGRISYAHKVKAASFAIEEYENQQNGTYILPVPPDISFISKLKTFWLNHWKFILPFLVSMFALYIAYLGSNPIKVPNVV